MATTDDLRALLPDDPNGWPPTPGLYVYQAASGWPVSVSFFDELTSGHDSPNSRHAPLRLETSATAQAEMALHLAGFEGSILDAVGAALSALDAARAKQDEWRATWLDADTERTETERMILAVVEELRAAGMPIRAIADELAARGFKTSKDGRARESVPDVAPANGPPESGADD